MYISSIDNRNKIHRNLSFNRTYTVFSSSSFSLLSMSFLFVRMTKPLFIIIICHLHSIRIYFIHLVSFISRLIRQFSLFKKRQISSHERKTSETIRSNYKKYQVLVSVSLSLSPIFFAYSRVYIYIKNKQVSH